jgi:zinc protease
VPQVVLRLVLPAGSTVDPAEYPGTASLVGHLLTEGTATLTAEELHARLDLLGAAVHPHVGHDFAEIEMVLLSETLAEGVSLLADVVTRPSFPRRKRSASAPSRSTRWSRGSTSPPTWPTTGRMLEVFGAGHPYGLPSFGTEEGIRTVPREALAAFHASALPPRRRLLVAAGEFDAAELRAALEASFAGGLGRAAPPVVHPPTPEMPARAGKLAFGRWDDAAQSEIRIAGPGLPRRSPDWIAGGVANFLLGGSTITGRLGANLREDKGWTYGARSSFSAGVLPGGWVAETAVDVEVTADAVAEMLREMRRLMRRARPRRGAAPRQGRADAVAPALLRDAVGRGRPPLHAGGVRPPARLVGALRRRRGGGDGRRRAAHRPPSLRPRPRGARGGGRRHRKPGIKMGIGRWGVGRSAPDSHLPHTHPRLSP